MWWPFRASHGGAVAPPPAPPAAGRDRPPLASWALAEGDALVDGRHVLEPLGGGSRYEVFLVWDERLLALAVAKVLRPDQVADPRALAELRREAELLARLAHPGLVRGLGAVLDGPRPHLLLEHVDGPSLHRLIRREGALPLDQLLPLALSVVAVLHHLAAEGVVHLDVKPANVVMTAPPRLLDLSVARPIASAARLRVPIGTDAYMAPEQCDPAASPGAIGPPADVFGLGATLHHAVSGEVPFPRAREARASRDPAVRFPQLTRPPRPLPPGVPPELQALLAAMLAPGPAARPAPREVAEALEPLVAARPARRVALSRRGRPVIR